MTTLIVVRHGQSLSNLRQTFTGQIDSPLTELGVKQAERTAEYLKDRHIDAIYSSDLSRAMETARPVAEMRGLPICPDTRLREICGGDWEGKNGDEISVLYPENYEIWKTDVYRSTPDGGESFCAVAARVRAFVREILEKHAGECVAIFSHALAVRALSCDWFSLPLDRVSEVPFAANASVSVVNYHDDGKIELLVYGYCEHQAELTTHLSRALS